MSVNFVQTYLQDIVIHKVGNKFSGEGCIFSRQPNELDKNLTALLTHFFLKSFKTDDLYSFNNDIDLSLNTVYVCIKKIFDNPEEIYEQSLNLAKYLYSQSIHPNIKGGEFFLCRFSDCYLDGILIDAIGIFKTEVKDIFLEVGQSDDEVTLFEKKGINIDKLDKGCIVFNTHLDEGYRVLIVDNTNKSNNAKYWKDDFLSVSILKDDFYKTNTFLNLTKKFVTSKDFDSHQENENNVNDIDILKAAADYFTINDKFNHEDFNKAVLKDDDLIKSFKDYKLNSKHNVDELFVDDFYISEKAVEKKVKSFKKILKLDGNFQVYIYGENKYIEKGVDENGRKFYKFFYENEE